MGLGFRIFAENEFLAFGHPKIFYFEILGSQNLNLCLRPSQLNEFGLGQDIFYKGRKVMDFFILHKVLRMFRFTPLEMAKNFKNFIKAFFEVNHSK